MFAIKHKRIFQLLRISKVRNLFWSFGIGIFIIDGKGFAECKNPDLKRIPIEVKVALCDGTKVNGSLKLEPCNVDGQVDCISNEAFPSAERASIDPNFFSADFSIAGVSGLLKSCSKDGEVDCIASEQLPAIDTQLVDPFHIIAGLSIGGREGTYQPASSCSNDGEIDCRTNADYPTITKQNIDPRFVKKGVVIGGVTGRREIHRYCRNQADLAFFDVSEPTNLPRSATAVNATTDVISLGVSTHGMSSGSPIRFATTGTLPGGIVADTTYYAILPTATTLKIANSLADALASIAIDIGSAGTGTLTIRSAPDGVASIWDTLEDGRLPGVNPVSVFGDGSSTTCDQTLIVDVTDSEPNLKPSMSIPAGGTHSFNRIIEETLTGLRFSNIIYDGSGILNWTDALALCGRLDSGDGPGKWRLPTQKEWQMFYYAGGSTAYPFSSKPFWVGTSVSIALGKAFSFYPDTGYMNEYWYDADKFLTTNYVACARWE